MQTSEIDVYVFLVQNTYAILCIKKLVLNVLKLFCWINAQTNVWISFHCIECFLVIIKYNENPLERPSVLPKMQIASFFLERSLIIYVYRQTSIIICTLNGNKIVDHSHVGGAAPTTSSFST